MTYPIFNSIVNQVENDLIAKNAVLKRFKRWHEDHINAAGLEIAVDVSNEQDFIKEVAINFDWDRFRETALAKQLDGLDEHPMLQDHSLQPVDVTPKIDIELSWVFDTARSEMLLPPSVSSSDRELRAATNWMQTISEKVNALLADDDIITRWHLEVEGGSAQRELTAACLISYFQYSLTDLRSLNETHLLVNRQLQDLFLKSQKIRRIATEALQNAA